MTIDINKLRRLAQVATPGPWQFWHGWVATEIDKDGGVVIVERPTPSGGKYQARVDANFKFIAAANPAAISDLLDRLEAAETEALEEARLNGMGAERELALMAKLEAAEKAVNEAYQRGYETGQEEIEKERDDVAQQLVQSEIGKREISEAHDAVTGRLSVLADENTALRAKIAEMEQQEPIGEMLEVSPHNYELRWYRPVPFGAKLYTRPGAKGEGK